MIRISFVGWELWDGIALCVKGKGPRGGKRRHNITLAELPEN